MTEAITVILKSKSIPLLVDFCIEEKIEFSVRPQPFPDTDWEFNLLVKDIKTAVYTGMFLRENRIEINGGTEQQPKSKKPVAKKKEEEKPQTEEKQQLPEEQQARESTEQGLF